MSALFTVESFREKTINAFHDVVSEHGGRFITKFNQYKYISLCILFNSIIANKQRKQHKILVIHQSSFLISFVVRIQSLYMQLSIDQSYFGRLGSDQKAHSRKRLKKILRGLLVQVIEYCRKESKKLKKRHQYQSILFPNDYEYEESDQISQTLLKDHKRLANYPFYLTQCQLFIDNYHLKIIKKAPSLPVKFANIGYGQLRQFADWVGPSQQNILIGVTTLHIILVISLSDKRLYKYTVEGRRKDEILTMVNVSVHGDYFFAFSTQQCHICRYQNLRGDQKGLQKIVQKVVTQKRITKGEGIQRQGKFYAFLLIQNKLVFQRLQAGILLSKIDNKYKILHECKKMIINIAIHPIKIKTVLAHVIIAIATIDQVKLLYYTFQNQSTTIFATKENPVAFNRNNALQPPLLQFIQRQTYLLCAIAFRNRLYFAKIEADYCQFSKRIKFQHPIEYVNQLGQSFGLVIITNLIKQGKYNRKIYVTHQDRLVSFSEAIYTELVDKYEFSHQSIAPSYLNALASNKTICIYDKRQIFMLGEGEIQRAVLNTWQGIYKDMHLTQNIKLLKFLILLKHVPSPFLEKPASFDQLQKFFLTDSEDARQILLEYYYHMDMQPVQVNLTQNYKLMVPFILAHQVSNLNQPAMEGLMNWCLTFDERLVEQLIIGGSNCGWEIAVSKGWVRAFKVMVQRGMELEMPILKLYSMAYFQLKAKSANGQEKNEKLTNLGQKYLGQMVEYIIFILANFFQDLHGNGSNSQFKHAISVILKEQLWNFMMKHTPVRAIIIISAIFSNQARIKEINRFSPVDFISFHKRFKGMRGSNVWTNSEVIVSHISATFNQTVQPQQVEYIHMQHAKLMVLRYEQFLKNNKGSGFNQILRAYQILLREPYYSDIYQAELSHLSDMLKAKTYFRFQKDYIVEILKTLIKDQGKNLEEVYFSAKSSTSGGRNYEELECEMVDFLVYLWIQIYYELIREILEEKGCDDQHYPLQECDKRIKTAVKTVIRLILAQVEQNQQKFLCIHLLLASNLDGQNSNKVLTKFLACKNSILRERVFPWLQTSLNESQHLQEQIIVRLKDVIAVNKEQSRALLQKFYEGRQKEIIRKIDHDPQLQLQYLELIIKNANQHLQLYYTNLHLKLVLKLKPNSLKQVLQSNNQMVEYDIAQALRMTLAAPDFDKKNDTLIYLYQREGQLVQCIITYLTSFEILIFSYIALCERSRRDIQEQLPSFIAVYFGGELEVERRRLVNEIDAKFDDSIRLLFRIQQRNYDHLARYLRKFNSIWKSIVSRQYRFKYHYVQFITGYFGQLLIQLFERNCLLQLADWLQQQRADLLEFILQLKAYLIEGYDQMHIQLVILRSMAKMEKKMLLREIGQTVKKLDFCISSAAFCHVCDRSFGEQLGAEGLLFNCGHLYHRGCIQQVNDQDFCYQCVSRNQYKSMIQNQSLFLVELLKKFREKRRQKRNQEDIIVEGRRKDALISQSKKRSNRLALYDKKVTAIQNQAEIIDIKLMIEDYYSTQTNKK